MGNLIYRAGTKRLIDQLRQYEYPEQLIGKEIEMTYQMDPQDGTNDYDSDYWTLRDKYEALGKAKQEALARAKQGKPSHVIDLERTVKSAERRIERDEAEIRRYGKLLAMIEELGEDEYEDGNVLFFQKRYDKHDDGLYDFVALKVTGYWYLSGARYQASPYTWAALVKFMLIDNYYEDVMVFRVNEWERVI